MRTVDSLKIMGLFSQLGLLVIAVLFLRGAAWLFFRGKEEWDKLKVVAIAGIICGFGQLQAQEVGLTPDGAAIVAQLQVMDSNAQASMMLIGGLIIGSLCAYAALSQVKP